MLPPARTQRLERQVAAATELFTARDDAVQSVYQYLKSGPASTLEQRIKTPAFKSLMYSVQAVDKKLLKDTVSVMPWQKERLYLEGDEAITQRIDAIHYAAVTDRRKNAEGNDTDAEIEVLRGTVDTMNTVLSTIVASGRRLQEDISNTKDIAPDSKMQRHSAIYGSTGHSYIRLVSRLRIDLYKLASRVPAVDPVIERGKLQLLHPFSLQQGLVLGIATVQAHIVIANLAKQSLQTIVPRPDDSTDVIQFEAQSILQEYNTRGLNANRQYGVIAMGTKYTWHHAPRFGDAVFAMREEGQQNDNIPIITTGIRRQTIAKQWTRAVYYVMWYLLHYRPQETRDSKIPLGVFLISSAPQIWTAMVEKTTNALLSVRAPELTSARIDDSMIEPITNVVRDIAETVSIISRDDLEVIREFATQAVIRCLLALDGGAISYDSDTITVHTVTGDVFSLVRFSKWEPLNIVPPLMYTMYTASYPVLDASTITMPLIPDQTTEHVQRNMRDALHSLYVCIYNSLSSNLDYVDTLFDHVSERYLGLVGVSRKAHVFKYDDSMVFTLYGNYPSTPMPRQSNELDIFRVYTRQFVIRMLGGKYEIGDTPAEVTFPNVAAPYIVGISTANRLYIERFRVDARIDTSF